MGLATQYCALSYVKAKLKDFVREQDQVSLLENALIFQELMTTRRLSYDIRHEQLIDKSSCARLKLVDILLEHGCAITFSLLLL